MGYEEGISHKWQIVLAFMLGGAVSSIAQDPSDYIFFWAQSKGLTSASDQSFFWYWVPFFLYFALFLVGYGLAKTRKFPPTFLIYFYLSLVLLSTVASFTLPQVSSQVFLASVILGTFVSVGIILGLKRKVD